MGKKLVEFFKALGVDNRIKIIELLKERGPLTVNEIADHLKITASAASQHLKILRYAGFVRDKRKGYWVPYEINPSALEQCQKMVASICCCDHLGDVKKPDITSGENQVEALKKYKEELERELEAVVETLSRME